MKIVISEETAYAKTLGGFRLVICKECQLKDNDAYDLIVAKYRDL